MVFTPWLSASAATRQPVARFNPEGSEYSSYLVFRDVLSGQILSARSRVCVVTTAFDDRELGLMMFAASRRALTTAIRTNPRPTALTSRLERLVDEMRALGLPILELSLKNLKLSEPTVIALDQRAWTINQPLSETMAGAVEVESSAWTAAEVCGWAQAAQAAKATTGR